MRMEKGKSSWGKTTVAALMLFAIGAFSQLGYAQVKPGDFITPENASKVKNLVSPGVFYKVQHGMTMKIAPTERDLRDAIRVAREHELRRHAEGQGLSADEEAELHRLEVRLDQLWDLLRRRRALGRHPGEPLLA